ncbi:unnamed protein product [Amoebophrya sp. A25]|nr:unnamed protein product [Amoebophrya sp. A25]|eukprot:GSA25T00003460001.1
MLHTENRQEHILAGGEGGAKTSRLTFPENYLSSIARPRGPVELSPSPYIEQESLEVPLPPQLTFGGERTSTSFPGPETRSRSRSPSPHIRNPKRSPLRVRLEGPSSEAGFLQSFFASGWKMDK